MTVYFAKARGHDLFKIGHTIRNPDSRVAQLQVGCPYELSLYAVMHGNHETEQEVQDKLDEYKLRGEWFQVPESVIESLLNSYGLDRCYEDLTLDTGARFRLDLDTNELRVSLDTFPTWMHAIYLGTGDVIYHPDEYDGFLHVRDLIRDYPDTKENIHGLVKRTWPDRSAQIIEQISGEA